MQLAECLQLMHQKDAPAPKATTLVFYITNPSDARSAVSGGYYKTQGPKR